MKLKGKVAVWYWLILIGVNVSLLAGGIYDGSEKSGLVELLVVAILCNLILLPIALRNYVEIDNDTIRIVFGLVKDTAKISEIVEIYITHNPLSATAASLDRVVLICMRKKLVCAVYDKELLFQELKKRNSKIIIREKK